MAALWNLPVVFVCQNNQYAEMTPTDHTMKIRQVAERALGYGMPGVRVDGNDPLAVVAALDDAIGRARSGEGPTFVECLTFRFRGHYFGDPQAYIPAEQMAAAEAADPLPRFRSELVESGVAAEADLDGIDEAARGEIDRAMAAALAADPPTLDELDRDVYANPYHCPA
jgi:acetoin:2,6-dichlorophenolindophenol oxidoreductase subunit alpha